MTYDQFLLLLLLLAASRRAEVTDKLMAVKKQHPRLIRKRDTAELNKTGGFYASRLEQSQSRATAAG